MTRTVQPLGARGSLKWVQLAVNERPDQLDVAIPVKGHIEWLSPLKDDGYAEYRDAAFLERIGLAKLIATW
jgi:hypothetical protein